LSIFCSFDSGSEPSNKMHRLVHGGEQVTKFVNVENFLAMAEIVQKVHIKGPHNLPVDQ
jgi:hypothetical protein